MVNLQKIWFSMGTETITLTAWMWKQSSNAKDTSVYTLKLIQLNIQLKEQRLKRILTGLFKKIFHCIAFSLITGAKTLRTWIGEITLILNLRWLSPQTEQVPFYSLKPLGNCNMVMAQILRLLKWTQDQISQLACSYNNTENPPRHSEPFTIKLISASPLYRLLQLASFFFPAPLSNLSPSNWLPRKHAVLLSLTLLRNFTSLLLGFTPFFNVWSWERQHLTLTYIEEGRDNMQCLKEAQRQKVTAISELQLIPQQLERERSRQRGWGTER